MYSHGLSRSPQFLMVCWAFTCKHCQWVFTYSKIGETLADFIAEEKPKLSRRVLSASALIVRSRALIVGTN